MKIVVAVALVAGPVSCAASDPLLVMQCQQNLDDARVLISDGRLLPKNRSATVVQYSPTSTQDGWSYGSCTVRIGAPVSARNRLAY